jgi:2-oxoglutarate dehydrogenase E1 component
MSDSQFTVGSMSLPFVEELYAQYTADPASVSPEWRQYFLELTNGDSPPAHVDGHRANGSKTASKPAGAAPQAGSASPTSATAKAARPEPRPPDAASFAGQIKDDTSQHLPAAEANAAVARAAAEVVASSALTDAVLERDRLLALLQDRVDQLIRAFRVRGHMIAHIDPLGMPRPRPRELDLAYYGLTEADLDQPFSTDTIHGAAALPLRKILERLDHTYCRRIGVQFMHMDDLAVRNWLQDRMESSENRLKLSREEQLRIFTRLTDAVIFEEFLQKRYLGAKTFSLEGAESLIPLLELAIEHAGSQGTEQIVLGMAHRGRLNVLANILGKSARKIFREFEDADPELHLGRHDVKYHLGHSSDWVTSAGRRIHLSLCFNPSHLEFVNTVALGRVRAKQDRLHDTARERALAILIHGDAAFAGEGVVQETLNLSELPAYTVGGTIHIVVNNQVGFTTSPHEGRSSTYATDVAKMLQIPIFHVNGEDPEAVAQVVRLAMDFRLTFRRDVVIDMYCYRRRGHNEGDEPSFTQPLMYHAIEERDSVRDHYLEHLLLLGGVSVDEAEQIARQRREHLERELSEARREDYVPSAEFPPGIWSGYSGGAEASTPDVETGVSRDRLAAILDRLTHLPEGFKPHPKIERMLELRREMAAGKRALDWAAAEALAWGTLSLEGVRIRISGQDSRRGTFSHRHAVLYDYQTGAPYTPLAHLNEKQSPFEIFNSPLSETGVLGFEYGYSLDCPDGLVLWEAQFGDFANAAQVIIDQFLASAEDKWRRLSGLGLLLPHGFEGQGPEHSSARMERYLSLSAEDNMQVVYPTTPAQCFHLMRRQALRTWRKPLIVLTPKSLLRHPQAVSSLEDFAQGTFQRVLPDDRGVKTASRILLCTGKLYYELVQERQERKRDDVAIVRIEQLYPLAWEDLRTTLADYADGTPATWVQEEPENMGAWSFLRGHFGDRLLGRFPLSGLSRPASASPATGSHSSHKLEQKALLTAAFK